MDSNAVKVLLIDNSSSSGNKVSDMLSKVKGSEYGLSDLVLLHDNDLSDGLRELVNVDVDAVIFDLPLTDDEYLFTLDNVCSISHTIPIIIVSSNKDNKTALLAIQAGAQDYLVKGEFKTKDLLRSLIFSIERHKLERERVGISFVDELTGLYSHIGFSRIGEKHIKIAARTGREVLIVHAELRGLEYINAVYGYDKGNESLIKAGKILKRTFRGTDIIARVGWNKFAALAIDVNENTTKLITKRLKERISLNSTQQDAEFAPTLSYGMAYFRPTNNHTIEEMLRKAEEAMLINRGDVLIY
jgi:two-component system, cell cycle response regulator